MKFEIKHCMEFEKVKIESNKVDPYCIHLEDYESINDLIERATITHTQFKPENIPGAQYDSDADIKDLVEQEQYIDQSAQMSKEAEAMEDDAERSEAKSENSASGSSDVEQTPIG